MEVEDRVYVAGVYHEMIRPFLMNPDVRTSDLSDGNRYAASFFRRSPSPQIALPPRMMPSPISRKHLRGRAPLIRQQRLYIWLHSWLLVHVPLSIALIVLGGIHAIMALRYEFPDFLASRTRSTTSETSRLISGSSG